jgi:hypothetical protein
MVFAAQFDPPTQYARFFNDSITMHVLGVFIGQIFSNRPIRDSTVSIADASDVKHLA